MSIAIITEFLTTTLDVLPYFFAAVILSALLETKLNSDRLLAPFIKGRFAIVRASLLAALLPGCACATVPLAENLRRKEAGLGVTGAFLLVSPLLGPHTIILTFGLLGLEFAVWRVIAALAGGIVLGYLLHYGEKSGRLQLPVPEKVDTCCHSGSCGDACEHPTFFKVFWQTTKKLGGYFLLGILIAAVLTVVIPTDVIPEYIGTGLLAYVIAAMIGIPVYVCEGEEIPITKALLDLQLGAGPAFTFMMGAVGTCVPTILMAKKILGNKAIGIYIVYWFVFAIVSGMGISYLSLIGS